jgi:hypothetical protein
MILGLYRVLSNLCHKKISPLLRQLLDILDKPSKEIPARLYRPFARFQVSG